MSTTMPTFPLRRGRPPGPRPDPEHRRRQLLVAAREAIAQLGPDASMSAIAARAGYGKPALYAIFEDKACLADALGAEISGELALQIGVSASGPEDPTDALRGAIDAFCRFVEREPALFRFLVQGAAGFGRSLADRRLLVAVGTAVSTMLAEGMVETGGGMGSASTLGYALMGAVFMAADWWVDARTVSRSDLVDQLTRFVGGGLTSFREPVPMSRFPSRGNRAGAS